jgi:hypothetical protein
MYWNFAIINNRLGEIYYDKDKNGTNKFWGHCYVKREDFKLKIEQKAINQDTKRLRIVYRNEKYKLIKK